MTNERPLSIIKLFFRLRFAQSTNMDMVGDWVVLLSRTYYINGNLIDYSGKSLQIVLAAFSPLCMASVLLVILKSSII